MDTDKIYTKINAKLNASGLIKAVKDIADERNADYDCLVFEVDSGYLYIYENYVEEDGVTERYSVGSIDLDCFIEVTAK